MIETRHLVYFLTIAREQSYTKAANSLHITQPALSKQMFELEEQLGVKLFIRNSKYTYLTDEGIYFRARAQEMVDLMNKTENVLSGNDLEISGELTIGCGETPSIDYIVKIFSDIKNVHPEVKFHIFSGDMESILNRLDSGLIDIGMQLSDIKRDKYDYIELPTYDTFGLLMRKDDPLSKKKSIDKMDLKKLPLIISQQIYNGIRPLNLYDYALEDLNIVATYNLIYNATFLVENGFGYAMSLNGLVPVDGSRNLAFRPFQEEIRVPHYLVTKKYDSFSPLMKLFLKKVQEA